MPAEGFPGSVAIIGLGLIGGSLARDLARRGARVIAYDNDSLTLDAACAEHVIDQRMDHTFAGMESADVVILAVPVSATAAVLREAAPRLARARLVMDVGSTKRGAIVAAESLEVGERFVGAHPMAGDHRSGWRASRCGLLADATVFLCPTRTTRQAALDDARAFWTSLAARPVLMDAGEHDALVSYSSHLPHVASAALALSIPDHVGTEAIGPGGRDALRLARGSPDLWSAIMLENADMVAQSLIAFRDRLDRFHEALECRDEQALRALFADANLRSMELRRDDASHG